MMMRSNFWQGRRVFLTGHTGFKGSWLSLWLAKMGAHVTGFALAPDTTPNLYSLTRVADDIESIIGDVREPKCVLDAMRSAAPEIVFHLAAQPLVRYSYVQPVETYSTNVMGTVHVLEAVRQVNTVRAVVNVTSDKCYENLEHGRPFIEGDAMGGHDPYSSSKGCAELVTAAYRNSYFHPGKFDSHGVALASARAGNVIGGGDWSEDRLVPDIMRSFSKGERVHIRSPNAVRPWQHVLEPLAGYLLLAEHLYEQGVAFAEGWNFGPTLRDAKPVQWVVSKLTQEWGAGAHWHVDGEDQFHEANFLMLDSTKARERLRWHSVWTLEQTLSRIVSWHKSHIAGDDMREHCISEMASYYRDSSDV